MAPRKGPAPAPAKPEGKLARPKRTAATKAPSITGANIAKKRKGSAVATKAQAKKMVAAKPAAKKASAKKTAAAAPNTSKKRKAEDDIDEEKPAKKTATTTSAPKKQAVKKPAAQETAAKKTAPQSKPAEIPKLPQKGPVINDPPSNVVEVLVFGEGSAGELGLGTAKNAVDVKRPRVNANLAADKVGVVQISAGGMHVAALTLDNKILTWGVNDTSALGRSTEWDGGLVDARADGEEESDSNDDDSGLNPHEATPTEIVLSATPLAENTKWTKVVAGDTCTLALTDDGKVYGWGTFRCNEGSFGFTPTVDTVKSPALIEGLKNIVDIACGANHALALDNKGVVFAWGAGEQNQLGRRVLERSKRDALYPREVSMPKKAKKQIKKIEAGPYHNFAIANDGEVYAWGLNAFGQTGISTSSAGESGATIATARHVESLVGKNIVSIAGGSHHTIAATAAGECLTWGRIDGGQLGISQTEIEGLGDAVIKNDRGQLALLPVPTRTTNVQGHALVVAAGPENSLVVTKEGKAYSSGFSANYQTGLGTDEQVDEMTLIDNTAVRERVINSVYAGGQFSILTAQFAA